MNSPQMEMTVTFAPAFSLGHSFWEKVNKTDRCWLWTGAVNSKGYGNFWIGSTNHVVHRLSYLNSYGSIPKGKLIDHKCLNKLCIKPQHLRPATKRQNGENRSGANKNNTSGVRGVGWHRGKWRARVTVQGKTLLVGYFDKLEDAAYAVKQKRLELFTHNEEDKH